MDRVVPVSVLCGSERRIGCEIVCLCGFSLWVGLVMGFVCVEITQTHTQGHTFTFTHTR